MKKALALILVLVLALISVSAVAEGAFTYNAYDYDESLFAEIGGDWMALDGLGLKLYIPDIFLPLEVTEEQAAEGAVAILSSEDGSAVMTIAYTAATDAEGNAITTPEELAATYTAVGASAVDVIVVNGLPVVTYSIPEMDVLGYSVLFGDATQCGFSFGPASDAGAATLAALTITSLMEFE